VTRKLSVSLRVFVRRSGTLVAPLAHSKSVALKVYAHCTHPIFRPAIDRIAQGEALDEVVISIPSR
jgi:phosphoribosylpyrophosphate synthetase